GTAKKGQKGAKGAEMGRHAPGISSHPGDPGTCPDLGPSSDPLHPGSNAWGGRIRFAPTEVGEPGPKIPPPFPADPIRPTFGNLATQTMPSRMRPRARCGHSSCHLRSFPEPAT